MVVPTCKSECCATNRHAHARTQTHKQTMTRVGEVTKNIWFTPHSYSPFRNYPWRTHRFCLFTSSHYFSVGSFLVYQSCTKYSVMNAEIRQINYELLTLINSTTFHIVFITVTRKRRDWKEPRKVSVRTAYLKFEPVASHMWRTCARRCTTTQKLNLNCELPENKTRQEMYVERNNEARSQNHCCSEKAISITYSECVSVALGIHHATLMHRVILSSVACPALLYFSLLPYRRHDFRGKGYLTYNGCFDFLYKFCLQHFSF